MIIETLSPALSVSPQVVPQQVATLAKSGFRSIICKWPDDETGSGQPGFPRIAAAADMQATCLPIIPERPGPAEAADFRDPLGRQPAPILAFCRSGK